MKVVIASFLLVLSFSSIASSELVLSAKCFNKNESKSFDVMIPEDLNDFNSLKIGIIGSVVENSKSTKAVITKISKSIIKLSLEDGRLLSFNQDGGYKTKLGNELFICSNPIGF